MTKKELISNLLDKKVPDDCEISVLCISSRPISVEVAYYDKPENRFIIETN